MTERTATVDTPTGPTAEQIGSAEYLVGTGAISREQADAILAGYAPAAPAADQAEPENRSGGLSDAQLRAWADQEVKAGRQTREEADAMLKADGVDTTPQPADPNLSEQAGEIDAAFPAAEPHEYDFSRTYDGEPVTKEQMAFDTQARTWLSTAKFTKEIGSAIAREVDSVARTFPTLEPSVQELYKRTELTTVERIWGKDTPRKMALAKQLCEELDARHPGVIDALNKTGAGNSARVIIQIGNQAERLYLRKKDAR